MATTTEQLLVELAKQLENIVNAFQQHLRDEKNNDYILEQIIKRIERLEELSRDN